MKNEILKNFIGENYEKITTRQFNIPGFFFGTLYMFYRKMYLYATIFLILNLIIYILLNNMYVGLLINILIALFVNKIYVSFANNKINKIKEKEKSEEEIKKICKEQGGTSAIGIFIGCIIELLLTGIYVAIAILVFGVNLLNFVNNQSQQDTNNVEENDYLFEDDYVPGVYNGTLIYEDSIIKDEFTIKVPSVFTDNSFENSYNFEYENEEETEEIFKKCGLSITAIKDFNDSQDLISQMIQYHKDNNATSLKNETINNISWYSFTMKNDIGKYYYYATNKNNKVFLLTYEVQTAADSKCETYKTEIINSIKNVE